MGRVLWNSVRSCQYLFLLPHSNYDSIRMYHKNKISESIHQIYFYISRMELTLTRSIFTDNTTIGSLVVKVDEDDTFNCYILEDADRNLYQNTPVVEILRTKQLHPKKTCIPYGTYEVAMTFSNRFKRLMPQLLAVPGFEGIRIHAGNKHVDSEGCLLPGLIKAEEMVLQSRAACAELYMILADACAKEKVLLTIKKAE